MNATTLGMKHLHITFCLGLLLMLSACSTDIDLYADYKQVPVVYGLLDANADTNFIKITRAFYVEGDAYQVALNPDSSYYPGKLDVRLVEYCNGDSLREIILDTVTIHNKEHGVFYAPDQKLYYTTEPICQNTSSKRYSYRLKAMLPESTLNTQTAMVGNSSFGIQSLGVNFSKQYFGMVPRQFLFRPAINGRFYQVTMSFTFLEQRTPDSDSVPRTMTWEVGIFNEEFCAQNAEGDAYAFPYRPEDFYTSLTSFLGNDTAIVGLSRFINDYPVEVRIVAGGEELRQYVFNNDPNNGFIEGDNEFSLIDDGYGVFSSRMTTKQAVRMGGETVPELVANRYWGFKFIGGK